MLNGKFCWAASENPNQKMLHREDPNLKTITMSACKFLHLRRPTLHRERSLHRLALRPPAWDSAHRPVEFRAAGLSEMTSVFIAGATGYMGSRLAARLLARGHAVTGLVRAGSEARLPAGCRAAVGNALDHTTFSAAVTGLDTYVQLVGVSHPSPAKAREFETIDRVSCEQSLIAAQAAGIRHFVYVSVAHPAPMMKAYIKVRTDCEAKILESGLRATILRPWYVLGPGHSWPYLLKPAYWVARQIPSLRDGAVRLGLVTLEQMLAALLHAVENPPQEMLTVWQVPEIQQAKFKG
jgi:uncharacterized protein YbjT (DUF2867 family)